MSNLPTTNEVVPPVGPNAIVTSTLSESTAFKYRIATLASALVTPVLTYVAVIVRPKSPDLALLVLSICAPLTAFFNSMHGEAVRRVALNAASQAANRMPGDDGPKSA